MSEKLLPCPFCGTDEGLYPSYHWPGGGKPYAIDCIGCGFDFVPRGGFDVVAMWNRRDTPSQRSFEGRDRMSDIRPKLRECPMCHADGGNDEIVYFTKEVAIGTDCEFNVGYSIRCVQCGVSVHDEYSDEVARLWNGEAPSDDDEDAISAKKNAGAK